LTLIKIPFNTGKIVDDGIDREALKRLGVEVPPYEYEGDMAVDFWIKPDIILTVRPNQEAGGSLVDIGDEVLYESSLEPEEIAKLVNEA